MFESTSGYRCPTPFLNQSAKAVAVYCSDGRFAVQFDQFIEEGLGIPCCDRIVIPGGPAYLANHAGVEVDGASLLDQIIFMVEAHRLDRVVLIMHADCGCYAHKLGYPAGPDQQERQTEDLAMAMDLVQNACPNVTIDCFIADLVGDEVIVRQVRF